MTIFKANLAIDISQTTYLCVLISRFQLIILFKGTTGWIQIHLLFHENLFFFFVINSCYYKRHMNIISKYPMPPLMMTINEKEKNEVGLSAKFQLTEIEKTH